MQRFSWSVALVLSTAFFLSSAHFATAADAKPAKADKPKVVRLTKPWKDIASLTDEQKSQLVEIHRKALDEAKQVAQREHDASMAVLNDAQKTELTAMQEKESAEKKMKKTGGAAAAKPAPTEEKPAEKAAEKK